MTDAQIKRYLSNYKRLNNRKKELEKLYKDEPRSRAQTEESIKRISFTLEDIAKKIFTVDNGFYREILIKKYIEGETLEELGESIGYSTRHIQRLVNQAVNEIRM